MDGPHVHIFDVDLTIVRKTTAEHFIKTALCKRAIRFSQVKRLPFDWIKYKIGSPDVDFIENTVKNFAGIKRETLEQIAGVCFEKKIKPNIYKGASDLIWEALKKGEKVIFATSSLDFIIKPVEKFFGIEGSLASGMEYVNDITTGKLTGCSFFGHKKKDVTLNWMEKNAIDPKNISFYSDSFTDIPLLEYCGNPVAVNPDRTLKEKAVKNGWKILYFKKVLGK